MFNPSVSVYLPPDRECNVVPGPPLLERAGRSGPCRSATDASSSEKISNVATSGERTRA